MVKPSLIEIALNWNIEYQTNSGKQHYIGARIWVEKQIEVALDKHGSYIACMRFYVKDIVTENNIQVIKLDNEKGLYKIPDNQVLYKSFSDTPLYHRLEDLRLMNISLKDVCNNAAAVSGEIKEAVIGGFEKEIIAYNLDGVAAYPCYVLKPYPLLGTLLSLASKKAKEIQQAAKMKVNLSANETFNDMLQYFSVLLKKYSNIEATSYTIEWSNMYILKNIEGINRAIFKNVDRKLWHNIDLKALLKYIPHPFESGGKSNFKILYDMHGKKIYDLPLMHEALLQMKDFIIGSLSFENIILDIPHLNKLGMVSDILSATYIYNDMKIGFLEGVFCYRRERFDTWIKLLPGDTLLQILYIPYDIEKRISMLDHLLSLDHTLSIFRAIAQNCKIDILAKIANIKVDNIDKLPKPIYEALNDANFAQIVLKRLDENGRLSELNDLMGYHQWVRSFDIEQEEDMEASLEAKDIPPNISLVGNIIGLQSDDE